MERATTQSVIHLDLKT